MSTRCWIFNQEEGACRGIYCHHDGYPSYVGANLDIHYNKGNIRDLLGLGDISSLDETIDKCVAYHRDRGEDFQPNMVFDNPAEILEKALQSDAEYVYYLDGNGTWYVVDLYGDPKHEFKELKGVLEGNNLGR